MSNSDSSQTLCPHCRGGNPPAASVCMWCNKPMVVPPTPDVQTYPSTQGTAQQTTGSMLGRMILNEEQDPAMVEQVKEKISQILTRGEEMQYIAVQKKPGVNLAPDCVVLTSKRFIIYRPRMFGRVDFEDYIWRDLHDARLKEGMLGATFMVTSTNGHQLAIDSLPKAQARRLYQFAQEMEEYVRDERRWREMEERRAGAAGIYMQGNPPPSVPGQALHAPPSQATQPLASSTPTAQAPQDNPVEKLKQLKQLLDEGLIPQEMYDAKRDEILSRM